MSVYRHADELNEKAVSLAKEYAKLSENYSIPMAEDIVKQKAQTQTRVRGDTELVKAVYKNVDAKNVEEKIKTAISNNKEIYYADLTEKEKRDILKQEIENHNISIKLNHEKQAPHIYGSKEYDPSRNKSYFTISEEELQKIINQKHATGQVIVKKNGQIKEIIELKEDIAVNMDENGENQSKTNRITIHYSKNRTHIVPAVK